MKSLTGMMLAAIMVVGACGGGSGADTTTRTAPVTAEPATTTTISPSSTTTVPPTTTTVVDPDALIGSWIDAGGIVLTFDEDGMHHVGYRAGEPFEFGPYLLEGNRLTLNATGGSDPVCLDAGEGVYDIEISPDGSELRGAYVSDGCAQRANSLVTGLTRYTP